MPGGAPGLRGITYVLAVELKACQPEGPEGTRLGGCVKTYLPAPDGPWGMVLRGWDRPGPGLAYVAFGLRHPRRAWQPSVYQVAHRRLLPPA